MADPISAVSNSGSVPAGITLVNTLKGHTHEIRSIAWSPDGTRLASGACDGTMRLWDGSTGRLLHTSEGHLGSVNSVTWSPDGTQLASCSAEGFICLWDGSSGTLLRSLNGIGHTDYLNSVMWSPDGTRLVSDASDQTLWLWDVSNGTSLCLLENTVGCAWSPDGTRFAACSGSVRLWDGHSGVFLRILLKRRDAWSVAWSPDGTQLASCSRHRQICLWDGSSGKLLHKLKGHTDTVSSVVWSHDGKQLASCSPDGTVRLWDRSSRKSLHILEGSSAFSSVAWSSDDIWLAAGTFSFDQTTEVRIWHASTGAFLTALPTPPGHAVFAWHPTLPLLATLDQSVGDICLWQLDVDALSPSGRGSDRPGKLIHSLEKATPIARQSFQV